MEAQRGAVLLKVWRQNRSRVLLSTLPTIGRLPVSSFILQVCLLSLGLWGDVGPALHTGQSLFSLSYYFCYFLLPSFYLTTAPPPPTPALYIFSFFTIGLFQFISVQSLSRVRLFVTP